MADLIFIFHNHRPWLLKSAGAQGPAITGRAQSFLWV
jgi:hypothetical protein